MLQRYYEEAPGEFEIPADPEGFLDCDDMALHLDPAPLEEPVGAAHRAAAGLQARGAVHRAATRTTISRELSGALTAAGVEHFTVESRGVLSKYFDEGEAPSLFVLDKATGRLTEVAKYTPLYQRFSGAVRLSRVYARPDQADLAQPVIAKLTGGAA